MPKLKIATNKMHTWPHFASHTQSSLMKTRTPMKLKKLSSIKNENESKSQKSVVPKSKGIYKKRSNITKQSKSMQMLVMILKQKDRHSNFFLPGDELTETTCQLENSLISFQDNLIKDVSHNLKNCIASPAKLATLRSKRTKVMNEFGSFAENLHDSSQDGTNCAGRDNSDDTYDSEACTVIDVTCKLQLHLSDEEDPTDSCSKVEDLHRRTECEEKPDDISDKDCTEIQVHPQGVNIRKHMRKTWMLRKARIQNEHVNVDRTCADLQKSETTQHVGTVVNNDAIIQKRGDPKKNLTFYQRGWRPAGVLKNFTKSTTSLQPMSQKSSQSTENPSASTKSKHLSTECIKSFNSESTRTSETQSKMLMKENRDPHANRTKMFDHLADIKQQQRLQSEGMLPKKKWSRTKIPSKVLDRCDDTKPTLAKSKSRHCQTRPIILDKSSNNIEQHRTKSNLTYSKSKTSEIIHTLRKIIDSVRKNDDAEENVKKNDDIDHEKNDNNKIQMSSNSDTLQNDELHSAKDINLDRADRSSRRSISTQVKLDSPSYHEIDAEKDEDLMEILNLTRIIATQTLPSHIRNVVDVGCNTPAIVYKDVEISCDLIGSTDLTEIESTMIEDKSMSNVHTESSSIKHIKVNVENEDINENKELLLNECKETLNTRLENCDSIEIPANTINDAAGEIEKFIREEVYRIFLKSFKNSDKTNVDINEKQESAKCSSNHNVSNTSINNLFSEKSQSFICDYDTSCSSEDIMEYLENNIQQDVFMSESKVEDLTSDVIATFELAADRARNLHEAVIIYHKNLMSKESGKRNEEMVEDYEMLEFSDEQNCSEGYTSISRENENKIRSECDAICHFANNEDFDGFSTCSSRGSSYDRTCRTKFLRSSKDWDYYVGMEREEENAIFSGNEQTIARSILNKRSNLEDVKSMMQLVHRTQEDYALELLESDKSDESFKMERIKNDKILALPPVTKKPSFISRQYLLSFFYCIVYTVVFWYLQYSFRCDSKK
ncbi:PREDICTED: uncharacterized protein LOC108762220 [Trachymyrmex cornetzi]|uniref:Uncharacterized protein n=1 Tax=Trachymyrmex cornetzi TaxID=471704 RepID=A0A195ENW7_9HYME|nr:PREDICTED: uncharacterized protein LOC108762220 [Trachymyrmex cornetzi]KYN29602.1 hypothetical protein ALC57_00864 [Trachymyrmex cornetzi]